MPQAHNPLAMAASTTSARPAAVDIDQRRANLRHFLRMKREKAAFLQKKSLEILKPLNSEVIDPKLDQNKGKVDGDKSAVSRKPSVSIPSGPDGRVFSSKLPVAAKPNGSSRPGTAVSAGAQTSSARKKNNRGMQVDAVYREFHGKFLEETAMLKHFSDKYSDASTSDKIPEEFVGDLESLVGQAKLLLDSKLPQFAELLYFYVIRQNDPHEILACDLEGWWAVAEISIEKIKRSFMDVEASLNGCSPKGGKVKSEMGKVKAGSRHL